MKALGEKLFAGDFQVKTLSLFVILRVPRFSPDRDPIWVKSHGAIESLEKRMILALEDKWSYLLRQLKPFCKFLQ